MQGSTRIELDGDDPIRAYTEETIIQSDGRLNTATRDVLQRHGFKLEEHETDKFGVVSARLVLRTGDDLIIY